MSLDSQPKNPLNMNYLVAAGPARMKRVNAARFGRLKRGNMRRRSPPSSVFSWSNGVLVCWSVAHGLAITPLLHYSIIPWEKLLSPRLFLRQISRGLLRKFIASKPQALIGFIAISWTAISSITFRSDRTLYGSYAKKQACRWMYI